MKDYYVEWLVKKERSFMDKLVRTLSVIVLVICALLWLLSASITYFIVTVLVALFSYFAFTYTDVEYEYVCLTGEFSIDRILAKSKRKRIEKIDMQHMEIVAPINSDKLAGHAHKKYREYDYTSGIRTQNSHIFVMYCNGKKILFEPNRELMEAMKYEDERVEEVERLNEIVGTDEYVEKVARDKLGMVKEDEKLFVDVEKED